MNGPFSDTEVSIYCDESRHEGQSQQRYFVIGGLWLPRNRRMELATRIRAIRQAHGISGEMKWTKLSQHSLPGYSEIAAFIAAQPDVHFRCIVVDRSRVDTDKYFQNDRQLGFWVFYWHGLKQWIGNRNTYYITIDFKPEGATSGPAKLREVLTNHCVGKAWIRSLNCTDSNENPFCQIADLFIGAVGYEQNNLTGSPIKTAFATHLAKAHGRPNLLGGDQPARPKFNIFKIWS